MKVAILETVKAVAGFELEFDRIIIEALRKTGHEPVIFTPEGTDFGIDFGVSMYYLQGGEIVSYNGKGKIQKVWASIKREIRRVKWFDSAYEMARKEKIGAILLTTATYRYLRSLKRSKLRYSDIPVYFIFLGVNPSEKPKFLVKARSCEQYKNIHLCVTTLRDDFKETKPQNVRLINPPIMFPEGIPLQEGHDLLRIGFFGHYRKGDKNLDLIVKSLTKGNFNRPVELVLQLVPTTEEDLAEVKHLIKKYETAKITFITRPLIGNEWYEAINSVDILFLPYTAERYLYNWSALYFTAIGCHKPVLVTKMLNPEVLQHYPVGEIIDLDDEKRFVLQIASFIDNFETNKQKYYMALNKAAAVYGKDVFIKQLFNIMP